MAEDGDTEAYGQSIVAKDVLDRPEESEGKLEDASQDETDEDSGTESGTETETESETESGLETESESESDSESESESETESETASESEMETATATEAETTETECSTTVTGTGDFKSPRPQQHLPAAEELELLSPPPADDGAEPLSATQANEPVQVDEDVQPHSMQPASDHEVPAAPASWSLPPAPSRTGSREGSSPHQTPRAEEARASAGEHKQEGQSEPNTCSLPPAVSRNSSRECSRKSSHHEASTSGSGLRQSSSSLPPINPRSGTQQPSRKGSSSSSQPAGKRSQASSPKGSPSRNPIAAPRYFQPPPPPPPPPKPKPRERHDTSAVDPLFLQTAVYRTVPNVGRVYDWKVQHEVNAALSKQRKQQAQMEKVLEAARLQLQVREANERAFKQWVATKEQEKQEQYQQNRRIAYVTSVYQNLVKDDPLERKTREALWVGNFAYGTSDSSPPRALSRNRVSEDSERFRL